MNAAFEESLPEITTFIKQGGQSSFPFIFIDPTGWNGIAIETISPLLQIKPSEVLVNFMTDFIKRFVNSPQDETQSSFNRLFGSEEAKERVQAASLDNREDIAVAEYCNGLKIAGGFQFACSAMVLHPLKDTTHYHLIYATRDSKGVEVFKECESKAMKVMEEARAAADDRREQRRTGQRQLEFSEEETPKSRHYQGLRNRYLEAAKARALESLKRNCRIQYDHILGKHDGVPSCMGIGHQTVDC